MKKFIVLTIVFLNIIACNKDDFENLKFIGTWELDTVSGGLHGQGYETKFQYLKIINDHDCQYLDSLNNTTTYGTYELSNENGIDYIKFTSEIDSLVHVFNSLKMEYKFISADSLYMDPGCCDQFDFLYVKHK